MQSSLISLCKRVKEKYGEDADVQKLLTAIGYRDTSTLSPLARCIIAAAEANHNNDLWFRFTLMEPINDTSKYISDLWHCLGMIGGDELRIMLNNANCYKPIVWIWALSGIASRELQIPDHKRCDILQMVKGCIPLLTFSSLLCGMITRRYWITVIGGLVNFLAWHMHFIICYSLSEDK